MNRWLTIPIAGILTAWMLSCDEGGKTEDTATEDTATEGVPTLTTTVPFDIGADVALSGGNISDDGGNAVTARGVCWSTQSPPTLQDDTTDDGGGMGSYTSTLTGLDPATTYYVRAYATNSDGTGYGGEEVFTTGDEGGLTDPRDGNIYETTTIGSQRWMAENLRYLPEVHTNAEFAYRESPGYGVFGYDGDSVAEAEAHPNYGAYGVMYNWYAATSACPAGWHLPSSGEWMELETFISSDGHAGMVGAALKATSGWDCGAPGTDDYGFSGLAGGVRSYGDGSFFDTGLYGNLWASTEGSGYLAYYRELACSHAMLAESASGHRSAGYYVRCVRD